MSFILLGILNSQVTGAAGGSYELIESNILTSSASSVTFSSIPQDYKHLQIRVVHKETPAIGATTSGMSLRFNSDSGANYSNHMLRGNGSSVGSFASTSATQIGQFQFGAGSDTANAFSVSAVEILDYASTSKNTTTRGLTGFYASSGGITLSSGAWYNTNAVSAITVLASSGNSFIATSRFSLYGIRG